MCFARARRDARLMETATHRIDRAAFLHDPREHLLHHAGFVPDDELPAYYAASDVFAIASRFETQGLAVLEAMASGKPVAGTDYRAIPEFVRNGRNGFLFPPKDAKSAAAAIDICLDDRTRLGRGARETAEGYTVESTTRRLLRVYETLVTGRASAGIVPPASALSGSM